MLSDLVAQKLQKDHLSVRRAAAGIGIAHTTLNRILQSEEIDLETYKRVCGWLGISPADALHAEGKLGTMSELAAQLAVLVEASPSLAAIFQEVLTKQQAGAISMETVNELVQYAGYRLSREVLGA